MEWYKVLLILSVVTPILVNGQFRSNPFLSRQTQSQSNQVRQGYQIPKPTAIALSPGFQIKIPDVEGIVLFGFHGSINKEIRAREQGDFNGETRTKSNGGWWVYETRRYQLQTGDVLNFWIYVQHNNFGYHLENQRYVYPDHFVYNSQYSSTNNNEYSSQNNNDQSPSNNNEYSSSNNNNDYSSTNKNDYSSSVYNEYSPSNNNEYSSSNNNQPNYSTGTIEVNVAIDPNWLQDYTTRRTTQRTTQRITQRTTPRTTPPTTSATTPWNLVYEDPNNVYTQNTIRSTRPTRTTRISTVTRPSTSSNYWPTTTDQQTQYPSHTQNTQQNNQNSQQNTQHNQQNTQHNQQNNQNNQQNQRPQHNQNTQNNQNTQYTNSQYPQQQNCRPSITTVNKKHIDCKDTLIFTEQFNYNWQNNWSQDVRMPLEFEDAEFVVYENYRSVWNVSNGNLNIFPKLLHRVPESGFSETDIRSGYFVIDSRECTSFIDPKQECERQAGSKRILPPVVSAKFRSKKSFNFKFGRVEIRAKFPKGDWIFPELYLEPTDNLYRGIGDLPYLNGQIRIGFIRGNEMLAKSDGFALDGTILTGICVIAGGDTVRDTARKSIQIGSEHFGNDFHIYSIIWTNSSVRFLVDGMEYGTDTGGYKNVKSIPNAIYWDRGTNIAPFDQEFHVSLGVGVGGNADFPDDAVNGLLRTSKPWENTSPKAELSFYLKSDEWYPTWNNRESGLIVDYVKVYSV